MPSGLNPLVQAQPKVTVVKLPPSNDDVDASIVINAFLMGVLHWAIPMTVVLCLRVVVCVPHTLMWDTATMNQHQPALLWAIACRVGGGC
jgi:hypothetical protein